MTRAPFDAEQIASINEYQASGVFHPFTCGGKDCDAELVATVTGMVCPREDCPYVQDWVHPFMADGGWREHAATMRWRGDTDG